MNTTTCEFAAFHFGSNFTAASPENESDVLPASATPIFCSDRIVAAWCNVCPEFSPAFTVDCSPSSVTASHTSAESPPFPPTSLPVVRVVPHALRIHSARDDLHIRLRRLYRRFHRFHHTRAVASDQFLLSIDHHLRRVFLFLEKSGVVLLPLR